MRSLTVGAVLLSCAIVAACGGASSRVDGLTARESAERIDAAITQVSKLVDLDEDNDPNDLIGRSNGYDAATVLYDDRVECADLGVDCGATIEEWASADDASSRSEYIQGLLKNAPMLGSEYDYRRGNLLLRVSGELPPSVASAYEAAFNGQAIPSTEQPSESPHASAAAQPFNSSGLLGGNATPDFSDGKVGEVSVVEIGPLVRDDFGSATLLVAARNNTDEPIAHLDLTAAVRQGGTLVSTGSSQGFIPAQIDVGEVALGYVYFDNADDIPKGHLDYEFTAETQPADTSSFNTAPMSVAEVSNRGSSIVGSATNETGAPVEGPYSVSVYCFERGRLSDQLSDFADQDGHVEAGGKVTFSVDLYDHSCHDFTLGVSGWFS